MDTEAYDVSASYSGLLEPLGSPLSISAASAKKLHVWGGSALEMTVDADDKAAERYPYHASSCRTSLTSRSTTRRWSCSTKGRLNYIDGPRQKMAVATSCASSGLHGQDASTC